jgi:nucleotide-binding universal stress UspA family protein
VLNKVLLALDSSNLAHQVVQALSLLHLPATTEVILAHVVDRLHLTVDVVADRPDVEVEDLPAQEAAILQTLQVDLPYKTRIEVVTGEPAEEIVRLAHIHQVDLILMGSRGLTGLNRILKGSVSSQVVIDAPCSVFVIKQ